LQPLLPLCNVFDIYVCNRLNSINSILRIIFHPFSCYPCKMYHSFNQCNKIVTKGPDVCRTERVLFSTPLFISFPSGYYVFSSKTKL
jgi:hypothetical protein